MKHAVDDEMFLVGGPTPLKDSSQRDGLDFNYERHGNRNRFEFIFCMVNILTSSISNSFSDAEQETVDDWIEAFATE